jgi:hypothetical protein
MAEAETMTIEDERLMRLEEARRIEEEAEETRRLVGGIAQRVAFKLNALVEEGHATGVFTFMLAIAIAKDGLMDWLLDFLIIGEIPLVGQIPGALMGATLWFFMRMRGSYAKRKFRQIILLTIDCLPFFINNLPLTTLSVLWMWSDAKKDAEKAEVNLVDLKNKTRQELKAIDEAEEADITDVLK